MFDRTGCSPKWELQARNEVKWEMYTKKSSSRPVCSARSCPLNHIVPVARRYQSMQW